PGQPSAARTLSVNRVGRRLCRALISLVGRSGLDGVSPHRSRFSCVREIERRLSMNRIPLIPSFSPSGGEGARRAVEGDSDWFMAPIRVQILEVLPTHEPYTS